VPPDKVTFGFRKVTSAEKDRLVQEQFTPIAGTYDLADAILSFGLDSVWRRKAVDLLDPERGSRGLDICGGTARLAFLVARRAGPEGLAAVYDLNRRMLEAGLQKFRRIKDTDPVVFVQGDAERLSFPDGAFDTVTIGFGLRNLSHPERGLEESLRVLKPGGRLMILEFSLPENPLLRILFHFYSFHWVPLAGRLVCGTGAPFRYLAESVRVFVAPEDLAARMRRAGFEHVRFRRFMNGIAVVYLGTKPYPGQTLSGADARPRLPHP
jgi:demethylmenaquinone methyltransferase/2-methoxy-6-polyprenyl-1,4-benzoquinol methylase